MPDHPSPLRLHAFRAIWLASVFSYVGSFIEEVGHGWLMVTLTEDPVPVALLTVAATVPAFTLMVPAGLLADRWDRRKLLIVSQALAALVALVLAIATGLGLASPRVILLACAGLGVAAACSAPSWHTLVTELVPREATAEAVAYNSIAFNVARAVGPAIGGLILAWLGPVWAFSINAASFFAIIEVLRRYPEIRAASEKRRESRPESLTQAVFAPFRHVMRSRRLAAPFKAIALMGIPGACAFSLLPAFAKHSLDSTARGYGSLLAGFGLGAIAGGLVLKRARHLLGPRTLVCAGFALYGGGFVAMAFAPNVPVAFLCLAPAGFGWVTLSMLNATVQLAAPPWAKARVMALYQVAFLVSWSLGATLAGLIARATNERVAIGLGGVGVLAAAMFVRKVGLAAKDSDLVAEPMATPVPGRA